MTSRNSSGRAEAELDAVANRVGRLFKDDARSRALSARVIRGGMVLVGALLAGLSGVIELGPNVVTPASTSIEADPTVVSASDFPWIAVMGFVGVCLAFIGGAWSLVGEQMAPQALDEARRAIEMAKRERTRAQIERRRFGQRRSELQEDVDLAQDDFEWMKGLYSLSSALREFTEQTILRGGKAEKAALQPILTSYARRLSELMDFAGGEHWTIAVYKHDVGGKLHCVADLRSERSEDDREHRAWAPGEGVAGYSYQSDQEIIVADSGDPQYANWLHVPDKHENDDERYVSLASVPIRLRPKDIVWGVVVATSDVVGKFELDQTGRASNEVEPLRLLAGIVALIAAAEYHVSDNDT